MKKLLGIGFWELIARIILRNRLAFIVAIVAITTVLAMQWKNIRFSNTEANLIPADDQVNVDYNKFLKVFGEEGNLVVVGTKDPKLFTPKIFKAYVELMRKIAKDPEVGLVLSVDNLKVLQKNEAKETFEMVPFVDQTKSGDALYLQSVRQNLLQKLPFYSGLLYNKHKNAVRSAIYLKKNIVNTKARKEYILG
ncbi:MAG: RND family transporter, partial [Flavobacterium stagni]